MLMRHGKKTRGRRGRGTGRGLLRESNLERGRAGVIYKRGRVYDGVWMQFKMAMPPRDPFPLLFSSIRPTTRSFFTGRATRESGKHKKEEGRKGMTRRHFIFSLCARRREASNHDDGEGGKTFRFVTTPRSFSFSLSLLK